MRDFLTECRQGYDDLARLRVFGWVLSGTLMPGSTLHRLCADLRRSAASATL